MPNYYLHRNLQRSRGQDTVEAVNKAIKVQSTRAQKAAVTRKRNKEAREVAEAVKAQSVTQLNVRIYDAAKGLTGRPRRPRKSYYYDELAGETQD
ncbi:hypothetical protein FKW77_000953 [Venturia effusa]|uniref:Uncharacterized protein n=1 Tax=Venturia effusa TaxID=50376 RepID=A0A517L4V9_9PEZI|nr:hypothetical protein FKW77_000953 [Venturia effusa]